ncbi:LuxR C-terminal-related transcriptional regulator [Nocardia sp. R7R-8]|uniref:LuxR C-terminal-related transcriptional regulator n=1 Tax=Nocardia sp. R7R-8 TaxID=3459304 RepID=UPI00403DD0AE
MSEMMAPAADEGAAELGALRDVIAGPLHAVARRFSRFLAPRWPHTALVIFTQECTGRPRKVAGAAAIVDKITLEELEDLKSGLEPGASSSTTASIGGTQRWVWALRDVTDTLLVLVPRTSGQQLAAPAELAAVFGVVATSIRQQVAQASPEYLAESRAASSERARTIAELTAAHEAALVAILNTLRSTGLDDSSARLAAADSASQALVALRSTQSSDRERSEESASTAFTRLRNEVRQLLRHHPARVDFVPPRGDGKPLPGETAYAARAMTRATVLAFTTQPTLARLRIAWACDGTTLTVDVRDHESGELDTSILRQQLQGRTQTLGGDLRIETVPQWGSRVTIELPLQPPAARPGEDRLAALNRREREVLALISAGKRNKAIALDLGVTESTVKFHVAGILKKLRVTSRGEAAALGLRVPAGRAPIADPFFPHV